MSSHKKLDNYQLIGESVRSERKKLGLTQLELADHSGCGITLVNQLEKGKLTLQLSKVLDILMVLGLELHLKRGKERVSVAEELRDDR